MIVESATPCRFWFSDASSLFTPLIWKVAPRVPVLLKLMDDPDDAVGLFCPDVGFSWNPGKVSARVRKLPALSVGLSRICSSVSDAFTSARVRLIGGASPRTVTVSVTRGSSVKSTTAVALSATPIPSRVTAPKPASVAVTA